MLHSSRSSQALPVGVEWDTLILQASAVKPGERADEAPGPQARRVSVRSPWPGTTLTGGAALVMEAADHCDD